MRRLKYIIIGLLFNVLAFGQDKKPHESIAGIVKELPRLISIQKGETIDTAAVRELFHPVARLTIVMNEDGSDTIESITLNEFLPLLKDPYYEEGYFEKETHRITEEYKGMAHVFQTYYGKDSVGEEKRGVTSYQLAQFDGRWWIISLLWTLESKAKPIPSKYIGQ